MSVGVTKREREQFERAVATLNRIRDRVEQKAGNADQDVSFYLDGSGTLHLLVTPMHLDPTQDNIVAEAYLENSGGGDW